MSGDSDKIRDFWWFAYFPPYMRFENLFIYFLLNSELLKMITYLGIKVIMFHYPINCSKLTLLSCRIAEDVHLNSATTNLSAT
jgi:hypothetical protein